jgi:hypothetical protein
MKRIISAVAILAIVGGALAFKTAGQPDQIFCVSNSLVSQVLPGSICTASGQPAVTPVAFKVVSSGTAIPCPSGSTPFYNNPDCTNATGLQFAQVAP